MRNNSFLTSLYQKLILKKEINIVKTLTGSKSNPKLLDIACGTGWTTAFYKENDFDVKGIEPSAVRAHVAKNKYGLDIYNCYFEDLFITHKSIIKKWLYENKNFEIYNNLAFCSNRDDFEYE